MVLEEFFARGGFFDVLIALFVAYLWYKVKNIPNNQDTNMQVKRMRADLDTSFLELWDYVDNSIKPIRSRVETRIRRSQEAERKQEDLLDNEKLKKKGGIISRSQLKKYGTH